MSDLFTKILKQQFPGHESEYRFHPERRWKFDHCWPHAKIAFEVEGGIWMAKGAHNTGKAILRDIEKYNEATLLGWKIYRTTPQEVKNGKAIELLERIFEKRIDQKARKWIRTEKP